MDYQLTGTIKRIDEAQTFGSGFRKRDFIVETEGERFPQEIKLECVKDRCELLDQHREGERVTVHFNLRGHEHKGRHFVNLQAWRIDAGSADESGSDDGPPPSADEPPPGHGQEQDDIPF